MGALCRCLLPDCGHDYRYRSRRSGAQRCVAAGWQAWTWKNNGPVVAVNVTNAITDAETGEPEHYVGVEAVNTGRARKTAKLGFRVAGRWERTPLAACESRSLLPCRLESHSKATFFLASRFHVVGVDYGA